MNDETLKEFECYVVDFLKKFLIKGGLKITVTIELPPDVSDKDKWGNRYGE